MLPPVAGPDEPWTPTEVPWLYCDDDLLAVDKPAGLPVHPSSRYLEGTVVGRLRARHGANFAAPVHRLDRETSGVLLCARHRAAARGLSLALQRGAWEKRYLAICRGQMTVPTQRVDAPLAVGGALIRIGVRVDAEQGRPALTDLRRLAIWESEGCPYTLVEATPFTGRRHQIRAHLRHVHLPVVGDKIYGDSEALYERFIASQLTAEDWRGLRLARQALHAWQLWVPHPSSGARLHFVAPLPADLAALLPVEVAQSVALAASSPG